MYVHRWEQPTLLKCQCSTSWSIASVKFQSKFWVSFVDIDKLQLIQKFKEPNNFEKEKQSSKTYTTWFQDLP